MKMNLKNKNLKKIRISKKNFTSKNLFIFLVSLSIITIILGIIFFFLLSDSDKVNSFNNITDYFTIKDNYDYLSLLKHSILENTFNSFFIWILGLSVIGVLGILFIYFFEMFSVGFSLGCIFANYRVKGILGSICYLFPSKICNIVLLFLLTFFALKMSYKIIRLCFSKEEVNIKLEMKKYFKVLIFSFVSLIFISLLEVFVDPMIISLFSHI